MREQLAQLLFEHNNIAALHLADSAVLALYAVGKISGTAVDIGHTTTGMWLLAIGLWPTSSTWVY